MTWDPTQYLKFSQVRLRPALDLLTQVVTDAPRYVCDLGCGTGNITRILKERWLDAAVVGVDSSEDMIALARRSSVAIEWILGRIDDWQPRQPADVIYSNAALHWLPDHAALFPSLVRRLAPGGVLAVQMPRNFAAPSHTLITDVARAAAWHVRLEPLLGAAPVADPTFYYGLLAPLCTSVEIWETEYLQVLEGADPVKEWVKGTWLKPFLDGLESSERPAFEAEYARRLRLAYPPRADGTTLFPFRRLFILAKKTYDA